MHGIPNLIVPRNHISLRINTTANVHNHRRPQRFPAVLVVPHPLYADGLPDELGKAMRHRRQHRPRRVGLHPGRFNKHHSNIGDKVQKLRDGRAKLMRSLSPRPDRRFAVPNVGKLRKMGQWKRAVGMAIGKWH